VQEKYRIIKRSDIEKMDVIAYDPLEDYGGWGIRFAARFSHIPTATMTCASSTRSQRNNT